MKELITIQGVRGRLDRNGNPELNLEDVARGLGFTEVKNGKEYVKWRRVEDYLCDFGFSPQVAKGGIPTSGDEENSQQVAKDSFSPTNGGKKFGISNSEKEELPEFIPENIFYKLCFKASNETARKFQDTVTDEVLPSIRKHGAYLTPAKIEEVLLNPDMIIQLATTLKQEQEKSRRLESEVAVKNQIIGELKPKAAYVDMILQSRSLIKIKAIAKDYGMTSQEMNKLLYKLKIQYKEGKQWFLYKPYQNKGYTQSETFEFVRTNGTIGTELNTKWTQKGRLFIYETLKMQGILPMIEQAVTA